MKRKVGALAWAAGGKNGLIPPKSNARAAIRRSLKIVLPSVYEGQVGRLLLDGENNNERFCNSELNYHSWRN